jgi:hypothetical protein
MGFVTLQLTSLQLVSTVVDCEQRPQVYVLDTWWTPCTCRLWNTVCLKCPHQARGDSVESWVLLEVGLNCLAPTYPISTNYYTYRAFFCGFMAFYKHECTQVENKGTTNYQELRKTVGVSLSNGAKTLYPSRFMKQLFTSRLVQKFSCIRYYTVSRHRSPKRRKVTWLVAVWTLCMLF